MGVHHDLLRSLERKLLELHAIHAKCGAWEQGSGDKAHPDHGGGRQENREPELRFVRRERNRVMTRRPFQNREVTGSEAKEWKALPRVLNRIADAHHAEPVLPIIGSQSDGLSSGIERNSFEACGWRQPRLRFALPEYGMPNIAQRLIIIEQIFIKFPPHVLEPFLISAITGRHGLHDPRLERSEFINVAPPPLTSGRKSYIVFHGREDAIIRFEQTRISGPQ